MIEIKYIKHKQKKIMESLKVIISGPFTEKALLSNAIGELLERENLNISYSDNSIKNLVDDKYEDPLSEIQNGNPAITIEIENLRKVNTTDDLNAFYISLNKSTEESMSIIVLKEHIRKILLIE